MTLPAIIVLTGTDTGVGKTVTTAAIAAVLTVLGRRVCVYKPCQTGTAQGDSDCAEIRRLAGVIEVIAGVELREPLAPVVAARLEGLLLPTIDIHAERIRGLAEGFDHVLVEGSGGLLVELDADGNTLADLMILLGSEARCVVVSRPGLGTLNHTALTVEAAKRRHLTVLGIVLGTWPLRPGIAEIQNRQAFETGSIPLLGVLPENAAALPPAIFQEEARQWLAGLSI